MISIDKINEKKVKLTGRLDEMNYFIKEQTVKISNVKMVNDNFISCEVDNENNHFINDYYLEHLSDVLFYLIQNYSIALNKKVDFKEIEHTHIILDTKDEIIGVLDNYECER